MSDVKYWVWLQLCLGTGKSFQRIVDYFGSVEELYNSNYLKRRVCPHINDKLIDSMEKTPIEKAEQIVSECRQNGWGIITFEDERYPKKLKHILNVLTQ